MRSALRRARAGEVGPAAHSRPQYLAPGVLRELTKRLQSKLRDWKRPDRSGVKAELKRVEAHIGNVVDTLATLASRRRSSRAFATSKRARPNSAPS